MRFDKGMAVKQVSALAAGGVLTGLIQKAVIPADIGPVPTPLLVAGIGAALTMFVRHDVLAGASLGMTGVAGAALALKLTTAGTAGALGDASHHWRSPRYTPAEEMLGWHDSDLVLGDDFDEEEDEWSLGEEEWSEEIEI